MLLCTLTTGHAVIPFCRVSVGSPGVRCLGECSSRSLHPPGKAAPPTYSSVTGRLRAAERDMVEIDWSWELLEQV